MTSTSPPPRADEVDTIEPGDVGSGRKAPRATCLTILSHPDPARVGDRLALFASASAGPVALSRLSPEFSRPDGTSCAALGSAFLSRTPVWLAPATGNGARLTIEAGGSEVRVGGVPVPATRKFTAAELQRGVVLELARRVVVLLHSMGDFARCPQRLGFVGESEAMERLRDTLLKVADLDAPVLLEGESGTGKELAARAIHQASPRARGPLVSVNLAAVPASTAASELFGHTAGAFTGATRDHPGYFQRANGGSLFLDEIGATPPELQATLLRAIDSGEIQPVGASVPRRVDVRVLAATDAQLELAIQEGRFRAPLFHRLAACRVALPPLRDRRDDVGRLLYHFLRQELEVQNLSRRLETGERQRTSWLPAGLVARLVGHSWPGNVRQLHNLARHMVVTYSQAESVDAEEVLARLGAADGEPAGTDPPPENRRASSAEISDDELVAVMRRHRFGIQAAARELCMSRTTLYSRIERCPRLRKARDIGREELEQVLKTCAGGLEGAAERLEVSLKALKLRMKELGLR